MYLNDYNLRYQITDLIWLRYDIWTFGRIFLISFVGISGSFGLAMSILLGRMTTSCENNLCGLLPKTLSLFMAKLCDFSYPIYDLTKNLIQLVQLPYKHNF